MRHTARGWWLQEAGDAEPCAALADEASADVVVVGGGFTGLWAALASASASAGTTIALVDAGICGEGPSGRNGGFVDHPWLTPRRACGRRPGTTRARATICLDRRRRRDRPLVRR